MLQSKPLLAIVDDDTSVVRSLARLLRSHEYEVRTFCSALDFLDSLAGALPRLLILDVQMPELSGVELHARLKEMGCQIPVLYITAQDTRQTSLTACQQGTVGLLLKPFEETELLGIVATTVKALAEANC